jgi:hypothetical protein
LRPPSSGGAPSDTSVIERAPLHKPGPESRRFQNNPTCSQPAQSVEISVASHAVIGLEYFTTKQLPTNNDLTFKRTRTRKKLGWGEELTWCDFDGEKIRGAGAAVGRESSLGGASRRSEAKFAFAGLIKFSSIRRENSWGIRREKSWGQIIGRSGKQSSVRGKIRPLRTCKIFHPSGRRDLELRQDSRGQKFLLGGIFFV